MPAFNFIRGAVFAAALMVPVSMPSAKQSHGGLSQGHRGGSFPYMASPHALVSHQAHQHGPSKHMAKTPATGDTRPSNQRVILNPASAPSSVGAGHAIGPFVVRRAQAPKAHTAVASHAAFGRHHRWHRHAHTAGNGYFATFGVPLVTSSYFANASDGCQWLWRNYQNTGHRTWSARYDACVSDHD